MVYRGDTGHPLYALQGRGDGSGDGIQFHQPEDIYREEGKETVRDEETSDIRGYSAGSGDAFRMCRGDAGAGSRNGDG